LPEVDEGERPAASRSPWAGPASPTRERQSTRCRAAGRSGWPLLARLAAAPDVLLMDEPQPPRTWKASSGCESILAERVRAVLVVSHDRYFLEHVGHAQCWS